MKLAFDFYFRNVLFIFVVFANVNKVEKMSCQLRLSASISDLKAARRYLFPDQKEALVEGNIFDEKLILQYAV